MGELDRDEDLTLEMGDVQSYWEKLESLLTVDEVAEWIVHAGQLPIEVGRLVVVVVVVQNEVTNEEGLILFLISSIHLTTFCISFSLAYTCIEYSEKIM